MLGRPADSLAGMASRWSPDDRLELVDRLAARVGADSEAFFGAHGLGSAYARPGHGSSKKAKINAALSAAERRGDVDAVLDAVREHLGGMHTEAETIGAFDDGGSVTTGDKIFISHASADRALADLLRDTLILAGIPEDRIFYSSARGSGIPSGQDVRGHLRAQLQEAGLVLELISSTFLQRAMCLIELGGAWVLNKPTYPIVVPPLEREEAIQQIGDIHMGTLGTDSDVDDVFDELPDRLLNDVGLPTRTASWNRAIRHIKQQLPSVLAVDNSSMGPVPRA
jgi:hypothetical protein